MKGYSKRKYLLLKNTWNSDRVKIYPLGFLFSRFGIEEITGYGWFLCAVEEIHSDPNLMLSMKLVLVKVPLNQIVAN